MGTSGVPAVGGVVGDHGALQLGILILQSADGVLIHIHGAEYKVHDFGNLFCVRLGVHDGDILGPLGDGRIHAPLLAHSLGIFLPGGTGRGGQHHGLKPGMTIHKGDKTLPHHAGGADDANFILFHICIAPYTSIDLRGKKREQIPI